MGGGGGIMGLGEGARVSDFFTKSPNLKEKKFFWGGGEGGGRGWLGEGRTRVGEFFFTKNPNRK